MVQFNRRRRASTFGSAHLAGGFYAVGSSPAEFGKLLKSDYEFQGKLLKELGLTP
jgi:hypothetical protein